MDSSTAFKPNDKSQRPFKERFTFEQRKTQAEKIRSQYDDKVLLILEPAPSSRRNKVTESFAAQKVKNKFIVPADKTVGEFMSDFRKTLKLDKTQAIYFLTAANTIPPANHTMSQIDNCHRDEDQFLYMYYAGENAFGTCHEIK